MYTPSSSSNEMTAKQSFKELYKKNVGKELSDAAAQQEVLRKYITLLLIRKQELPNIEQGFKLK